jgi:hypothetical protein
MAAIDSVDYKVVFVDWIIFYFDWMSYPFSFSNEYENIRLGSASMLYIHIF